MRAMIFSLLLCFSGTQAFANEHSDADMMLDKLTKANHRMLTKLHKSRKRVKMKLHALGARLKTAAEWRAKWMKTGDTDKITRYLDGRSDNAKLWYLSASKANKRKMAKLGLGHIKIGYIEHWYKFNELTDTYNKLTKYIIKFKIERMKRDIADIRARINALNDRHEKQMACIQGMKEKINSMQTTVDEMLATVKTQNLGLEILLTFLRSVERGLATAN